MLSLITQFEGNGTMSVCDDILVHISRLGEVQDLAVLVRSLSRSTVSPTPGVSRILHLPYADSEDSELEFQMITSDLLLVNVHGRHLHLTLFRISDIEHDPQVLVSGWNPYIDLNYDSPNLSSSFIKFGPLFVTGPFEYICYLVLQTGLLFCFNIHTKDPSRCSCSAVDNPSNWQVSRGTIALSGQRACNAQIFNPHSWIWENEPSFDVFFLGLPLAAEQTETAQCRLRAKPLQQTKSTHVRVSKRQSRDTGNIESVKLDMAFDEWTGVVLIPLLDMAEVSAHRLMVQERETSDPIVTLVLDFSTKVDWSLCW
jgi:hypothetical protein